MTAEWGECDIACPAFSFYYMTAFYVFFLYFLSENTIFLENCDCAIEKAVLTVYYIM